LKRIISRRTTYIIIIVALLLHISLIILIGTRIAEDRWVPLSFTRRQQLPEQPNEQEMISPEHPEWAELKARQSMRSVPVIIYQEPATPMPQPQEQPQEELKEQPLEQDMEKPDQQEDTELKDKPTPEDMPTGDQMVEHPAPMQETLQQENGDRAATPAPKKVRRKKKKRPSQRQTTANNLALLAQMTQGLIDQMTNEGNNTINMAGAKNGTPTDEQLKYERYIARLIGCIQNAFHIQWNNFINKRTLFTHCSTHIAIGRDGHVQEVQIIQSSGFKDIDQLMINVIKYASSSFPPVPSYIKGDPFAKNYGWKIELFEGQSNHHIGLR
jgi:outer membrane biosynthesis protein TonB